MDVGDNEVEVGGRGGPSMSLGRPRGDEEGRARGGEEGRPRGVEEGRPRGVEEGRSGSCEEGWLTNSSP